MSDKTFDPGRYLTKVRGNDYLEVKWRLVWLREVAPDARIATEVISISADTCVVKASIDLPSGGSSTGLGSETFEDWKDFIEKAETKAIGRALAALGFGTQFCNDHDFGSAEGHVVDSPVAAQNGPRATEAPRKASTSVNTVPQGKPTISNPNAPASGPQLNFIRGLAKECGYTVQGPDGADHLDELGFSAYVGATFQVDWPEITKAKASEIIEQLQSERDSRRGQASFATNNPDRYTS